MGRGTKNILVLALTGLLLWAAVRYLLPLCFPFLLGLGLALAAEPAVGFLSRRLRLSRGAAAGIGVTAAFLGITTVLLMACAFLVRELGQLAGVLPDLAQTAQSGLTLLQNWLLELSGRAPRSIRPMLQENVTGFFSGGTELMSRGFQYALSRAGAALTHVPDSALSLGTAVISGFMISAKLPRIRLWFRRQFPRERLRPILQTLGRIRSALGAWITAQLRLTGVTLGILLAGFLLLRVPYWPLWALCVCLVDAFPVLGTGTVLLPWALVCFLQADKARAIGLVGLYAVISLTRSVLEPKLLGRQLGLDPLATLFALYVGYQLWGIGGMILSPMLAVTAVQLLPGEKRGK